MGIIPLGLRGHSLHCQRSERDESESMIVRKMFVSRLTSRIGIDEPVVFHVGEPAEFAAWSIPRAIKILLTDLAASISVLASDRELLAVYATGSRPSTATEALSCSWRRETMKGVRNAASR
jgi:rhodanese-related sulfurtransferase